MAGENPFFSKLVNVGNRAKQPLARAVARTPFGKAIKNLRPNTAGTVREVKTSEFTGGPLPTVSDLEGKPGVKDMTWHSDTRGLYAEGPGQRQEIQKGEAQFGQGNEVQQKPPEDVLGKRFLRWLTRADKRPPQQLADIATGKHLGADADSVAASGAEQNGTSPTLEADISRPDLGAINDRLDAAVQPVAERKAREEAYATWQGVENKVKARLAAEAAKDPSKSYTEDDIATKIQRTQERYASKFVRTNLQAGDRSAVENFLGGSNLDPVFVDQARIAIQAFDAKNAPGGRDSLPGINTTTRVYVERQWQNVRQAAREAYTTRVTRKGGNPEDAKTASNMSRSVDRAQRRAVREYVTKSLDSNNRQALDKLLAEGKLDATLASQLQDAITKYDEAHPKDTTKTYDTRDTVDADVSTSTENATSADELLQEAEEIVQETENNMPEKKKSKFTREEIAMAREFVKWGKGAESQIGLVIDRAMELAPVEAQLAVAQDAYKLWQAVGEYKNPEKVNEAIRALRTKQLSDGDEHGKIEENIHLLERARDVLSADSPPTAEDIGNKLKASSEIVNALSLRAKDLRMPFQEALRAKVLANRQNTRFYNMLEKLPITLASSPDAGKQLLELYKLGKKKNTKALVLGILLLLSATTVSNAMNTGQTILKDGMSSQ